MSNLRYDMIHKCLEHPYEDGCGKQVQDRDTKNTYTCAIKRFCNWAKKEYNINNLRQLASAGGAITIVQLYEQELEKENKSPATIHTYLSPVCKGLGLHLQDIKKPKRSSLKITRSRIPQKNLQGKHEANSLKFSRLVEFQKTVGLRRSELAKLKVNSFARDESGYVCVRITGKGGKEQLQRILPDDIEKINGFMTTVLASVASSENSRDKISLFTKEEMNNKIDLHRFRAEHARKAYYVYLSRCNTEENKSKLQDELVARWNAFQAPADKIVKLHGNYSSATLKGRKFIKEFISKNKYEVRGSNKVRCLSVGLPIAYDRTALLAVSVFHLAHWRNDVTVTHYML